MIQAGRRKAADKQFAKIRILQYTLESISALAQNLFTVCHKQEPIPLSRIILAETAVIKCRNHRFTSTSSRYHQISVQPTNLPLCMELVQNLLLIGVRMDVEYKGTAAAITHHPFRTECSE